MKIHPGASTLAGHRDTSDVELLEWYRRMLLSRRFDMCLLHLAEKGEVRGPMHTSIGQEAAGIGATAVLREGDRTTLTHRPHAEYVGLGLSLDRTLAEMMGRATGQCRGRGGHMLVADAGLGLLGASGVVGHSLMIAVGHGYAQRLSGEGAVTLCVTGDGSTNTGAFNEALNMAALWQLPVVFFVQNNQYGLSVRLDRHVREQNLYRRAAGYGIPGRQTDGNDVECVVRDVGAAVERARNGGGPTLIEAVTYRRSGFSTSDRGGYQPPDEALDYRDPLQVTADRLRALGVPDERLRELAAEVDRVIEQAVEFASSSPWPAEDDVRKVADKWDGEVSR